MEERDYDGQERQQTSNIDALGLGAVIAISSGGVLLVTGIVAALTTADRVGAFASFTWGLTSVIIAATLVNGGIALLCHRLHANARKSLCADLREVKGLCRAVIAMVAEHNTSPGDQVGAARRSHEN